MNRFPPLRSGDLLVTTGVILVVGFVSALFGFLLGLAARGSI